MPKISSFHRETLKRFGQFPRNLDFFSNSGNKTGYLHKDKVQAVLNELLALGYICEIKTGYRITDRGRSALDVSDAAPAGYSRVPTEAYVPTEWRVRDGGDQHLSIPSRGMV